MDAPAPGRTTLLEAVNILLTTIGEQPVSILAPPSQQISEAVIAQQVLLERHKEGQARGWQWNTDHEYPLARDLSSGEVPIPPTAARVVIAQGRKADLIVRGEKVWDRVRFTYQIAQPQVLATVTWYLTWEESPEVYNRWATCSAARVFAARVLTDQEVVGLAGIDEQTAWAELQRQETLVGQPNLLHGSGLAFPTYDPSELGLQRRGRWL